MRILGIETSCDETSAAIVEGGTLVRSCVITSQRALFASTGGVIPEQAAREQVQCMQPVLAACLQEARLTIPEIDAIAVTSGPGLMGSLLVGTVSARALAALHRKPLIGVHHTLGHLSSTWLLADHDDKQNIKDAPCPEPLSSCSFPMLTLSASGGHTDLWYRTKHTRGILLGSTRDDAAGEAFDKGASLLGLPYPGGPSIAKAAEHGNPQEFAFPLPLHDDPSLDFSFSGLKTALRYTLEDQQENALRLSDLAASYQHAICAHLVDRITRALHRHPDSREVHIVGGVSANTYLRNMLRASLGRRIVVRWPEKLLYCTDNAAMIAAAGEFLVQERGEDAYEPFETVASLPLSTAIHHH
ncbi:tRNA (adenosine(37)-N6)-threonylcarbamoyltransferase complex transferase subunit TsaD [Candidatus Peribacteria bacterium]|nr:tRNA (adenosine(37)-N6)-threonylcarbamoyltransferase complex transferase subunit TsaD [Candidatus Peribacteria bacterium]